MRTALLRNTPQRSTASDLPTRIRALEAELSTLKQQLRNDADARLLRTIAISTRGIVFTVGDLFARTRLDRDLRDAVHGLSSKQLGKRLAACVGREIRVCSVRRVIATNAGWVWEIHIHHDAGAGD